MPGNYPVPHVSSRGQQPLPDPERNIFSGIVNIGVLVLVCASLSQPDWFWLEGGGCNTHSLGLYLFLHPGYFQYLNGKKLDGYHSVYTTDGQELKFCITSGILNLVRFIIFLMFLIIGLTIFQMMLDIIGSRKPLLICVRKNAVPSIFSVLICVFCVGLSYYITTLLEAQQEATKLLSGPTSTTHVQIRLTIGFYLLLASGAMSVVVVGCNWLRPSHIFQNSDSVPLVDDWSSLEETFSVDYSGSYLHNLEPPPPVEGYPPPPYVP